MIKDLPTLIEILKKENEIIEINAPVDPNLELAEIHRRVIDEQGPALLFTNVKGSSFPVLTNIFGTPRRVNLSFGTKPEQLMQQFVDATKTLLPPTPKALWGQRSLIKDALKIGMKQLPASKAPVMEVLKTEDPLKGLPFLTSWQEDGGPFVTLPLVYTEHPETKEHNLGMYRMQVFDDHTTGMHWQIHKGGGFHHYEAEQRNEALPATVFLGGPPALIASAIAPVPEHLPELLLTSLIMGEKLPMAKDERGTHRLTAHAEFALCGHVPAHERRLEGPFGDHYGYYSLAHDFPVFNVSHVYHRKNAIYPATIVGKPKQEDYYLGEFLQRLLSPAFPMAMPGVKDLWTYAESGFHPLAAAIVRESYAREALGTAFRILGEGQLTLTKFLVITDQSVALDNFTPLLEKVLERFDPRKDLLIVNKTSHDTLDYTGKRLNRGSKAILLGIGDPVRTLPGTYNEGELTTIDQIKVYCKGCLLISGKSYEEDPTLPARLLEQNKDKLSAWPMVCIVDDVSQIKDQTSFLWTVFTRFNPAMDIYADSNLVMHHLQYTLPIVIDARMKPGYPDELFPREDIVKKVDDRWKEYFA
ncbi:UbiD family decarboxylase [Longirhabdus pacifica]|uniref:UbiD family decarboxylase n=1 Tax=Longirhabdus pacifica TaxID=2305227 RepID=UPI00100898E6|nr:UbiD family decarboxylase [Longirhabdus pacifica]